MHEDPRGPHVHGYAIGVSLKHFRGHKMGRPYPKSIDLPTDPITDTSMNPQQTTLGNNLDINDLSHHNYLPKNGMVPESKMCMRTPVDHMSTALP